MPATVVELAARRHPCWHEYVCRMCGHEFATVGGNNWPEPWRTTCGDCLVDPEPRPPAKESR